MTEPRRRHFDRLLTEAGLSGPSETEDGYLWQIIDEGALGASRHGALARALLTHILGAEADAATGLARARCAARAIAETRGQDAPVIANVLAWLTAVLPAEASAASAELARRIDAFEAEAKQRKAALIEKAVATLGAQARVLAFDYSSTVDAIVQRLHAQGELAHLVVPESRCIAGGRRYLESFLPAGMAVRFLPDAAIDQAIAETDCVLFGVESLLADGSFLNTVGSRPVAERALAAGRRSFACTDLFKLDRRSYSGEAPPPRQRDFAAVLLDDAITGLGGRVSTQSPELERVPPTACTAVLCEHGPVPPAAIWHLGREVFGLTTAPGG